MLRATGAYDYRRVGSGEAAMTNSTPKAEEGGFQGGLSFYGLPAAPLREGCRGRPFWPGGSRQAVLAELVRWSP